jgi:hypothetical protein
MTRCHRQSRKVDDESTLDTNHFGNRAKGGEKVSALWQARRLSAQTSGPISPLQTLPPSLQGKRGVSRDENEKGSQDALHQSCLSFAVWPGQELRDSDLFGQIHILNRIQNADAFVHRTLECLAA